MAKPLSPVTIKRRISDATIAVSMAQKRLKAVILDCQARCDHKYTYYSDPSGNNDSSRICDHCDKVR